MNKYVLSSMSRSDETMSLGSREVLANSLENWSRPGPHSTDKTETIIDKSESRMHIIENKAKFCHTFRDMAQSKLFQRPRFIIFL